MTARSRHELLREWNWYRRSTEKKDPVHDVVALNLWFPFEVVGDAPPTRCSWEGARGHIESCLVE